MEHKEAAGETSLVYKILTSEEAMKFLREGHFEGSLDDQRDGFIHLSTAAQVAGTIEKHFSGRLDLVVVEFESDTLGADLRFEPSRGGDLFPHYYGTLRVGQRKRDCSLDEFVS